jgi:hypothetical protein
VAPRATRLPPIVRPAPFNVAPGPTARFRATVEPDTEHVARGGTTTLSYDPNGSSPLHIVTGAATAVGAAAATAAQLSVPQIRTLMETAKRPLTGIRMGSSLNR